MDAIELSQSGSIAAPAAAKGTLGGPQPKTLSTENVIKPAISASIDKPNETTASDETVKLDAAKDIKEAVEAKDGKVETEGDKPKEDKDEDKASERLAKIVKLERKIQLDKAAAVKEVEELKSKFESEKKVHEADIKAAAALQDEVASLKAGGPGALLEFIEKHFKLTITDLADFYIKGQTPEYKQKQFEQNFRKEQEEKEQARLAAEKEKLTKQEQENLTYFKNQITEHLNSNISAYKAIELNDAHDEVFNLIEADWNQNGSKPGHKVMSIQDAAKQVNDFLYERAKRLLAENDAKPTAETSKAAEIVAATEDDSTQKANNSDSKQPIYSGVKHKTLTNNNTARIPNPSNSHQTRMDRIARAAAAIK